MSHDAEDILSDNLGMFRKRGASEFTAAFIARTKQAREAADWSQDRIAKVLGIKQGTYKIYETRSLLPHRHVPVFCAALGITETWLFTGGVRRRRPFAAGQRPAA